MSLYTQQNFLNFSGTDELSCTPKLPWEHEEAHKLDPHLLDLSSFLIQTL